MQNSEIWKPVPGYEGKYEVSNLGRVKSLNYRGSHSPRIMVAKQKQGKYMIIGLRDRTVDKIKRTYHVHRLVAMAFIPNPNNYPIVNHKDETYTNNCVDNLEWCTYKYNLAYGTARERQILTQQRTSPFRKPVAQYTLSGEFIRTFHSQREASRVTGCDSTTISECCNNKINSAGGYKWRFAIL